MHLSRGTWTWWRAPKETATQPDGRGKAWSEKPSRVVDAEDRRRTNVLRCYEQCCQLHPVAHDRWLHTCDEVIACEKSIIERVGQKEPGAHRQTASDAADKPSRTQIQSDPRMHRRRIDNWHSFVIKSHSLRHQHILLPHGIIHQFYRWSLNCRCRCYRVILSDHRWFEFPTTRECPNDLALTVTFIRCLIAVGGPDENGDRRRKLRPRHRQLVHWHWAGSWARVDPGSIPVRAFGFWACNNSEQVIYVYCRHPPRTTAACMRPRSSSTVVVEHYRVPSAG